MKRAPVLFSFCVLASCAAVVPKAELDRCTVGIADSNDAMTARQGAACAQVAHRLIQDDQPDAAVAYARKACELQDPRGCEEYLWLVRSTWPYDELLRARTAGEKACSGMVFAIDGVTDARPELCARTASLYETVRPASREDAGRLYARACHLGDDRSCLRARSLGVDPSAPPPTPHKAPPPASVAAKPPPPPAPPTPPPAPTHISVAVGTSPACHEMRACVTLEVKQRNFTEVVGSLVNNCDRPVACGWCPAHRDQVDKGRCHTTTLQPGESRAGGEAGLWYEGFDSIAYDCADVADARGCLGL
jgi:hypothetical protein